MKVVAVACGIFVIALALALASGCTNGQIAQIATIGKPAHVICYSGTLKIYEGDSTGKVSTEEHSDGWFFQEAGSGNLIRISASCVVRN